MDLELIKNLLEENKDSTLVFKRNIVKEYLQILALSFIYSREKYQDMIFYGGSCLKHCFGLPRLSEDLDFIDLTKKISLAAMANDLKVFFRKEIGVEPRIAIQKFRIYLKFPVLRLLKLAEGSESDWLHIKVEIFADFEFCENYKIEIAPIFKAGKSFLVRTPDLPSLMATKIRAILFRKWEKTDKTGKILAKVKGRDYFDLMWYLEKGIKPNLNCVGKNLNAKILKSKLLSIMEKVDAKSIRFDLEGLIEDEHFLKDLSKNIKNILIKSLSEKL